MANIHALHYRYSDADGKTKIYRAAIANSMAANTPPNDPARSDAPPVKGAAPPEPPEAEGEEPVPDGAGVVPAVPVG